MHDLLPSTARTMGDPITCAAEIMRVSCSSALPCFGSNIFELGQIERIPISIWIPAFWACSRTLVRCSGSRLPIALDAHRLFQLVNFRYD